MITEQNKQLTFLDQETEFVNSKECEFVSESVLKIYIDGAARNNPGPSGSGILFMKNQEAVFEQGFFIGKRTNNQAEYFALLIACFFVKEYAKKHDKVLIHSDSQLLVRQMIGSYKIRDLLLKQMQVVALELLRDYNVTFCHVYREHNTRADALANRGIDKKVPLPKKFIDFIGQRGIV